MDSNFLEFSDEAPIKINFDKKTRGQEFTELRESLSISQREFSDMMGMASTTAVQELEDDVLIRPNFEYKNFYFMKMLTLLANMHVQKREELVSRLRKFKTLQVLSGPQLKSKRTAMRLSRIELATLVCMNGNTIAVCENNTMRCNQHLSRLVNFLESLPVGERKYLISNLLK